jgi:hypothetical protein
VTRQRASKIIQTNSDFPAPAAELSIGRVWRREQIEEWNRTHPRRPGRPCGVHKLDFADDQGLCTPIGIEYHHWCYRVSTLVPWLGSDGSADRECVSKTTDLGGTMTQDGAALAPGQPKDRR